MDVYGLGAVKIGSGVGSVVLGGITDSDGQMNNTTHRESSSGEVYSRFVSLLKIEPEYKFTTHSLASALAKCGTLGGDIATLGGVTLYYLKWKSGGTRETTGHKAHVISHGLLLPRVLQCDDGGVATIEYGIYACSDGTNDIVMWQDDQAAPELGTEQLEKYTLGPATIGGVALTQKKSLRVEFGLTAQNLSADGELMNTFPSIGEVAAVISLTGINAAWPTSIGLMGKACAHTDSFVQLKKMKHGGSFEPNASLVHPKITAAGVAYLERAISASGNRPAESTIRVETVYDGANSPLKYALAAIG